LTTLSPVAEIERCHLIQLVVGTIIELLPNSASPTLLPTHRRLELSTPGCRTQGLAWGGYGWTL